MPVSLTVDENVCLGCGLCVIECYEKVGKLPEGCVDHSDPNCKQCLQCYAACPQDAIRIRNESPLEKFPNGWQIDFDPLKAFLAFRRSTRHYLNKPLDKSTIERILAAAVYIPSGGNRHDYEFTVITQAETKEKLKEEFRRFYKLRRTLLKNPVLRWLVKNFAGPYIRAFLTEPKFLKGLDGIFDRIHSGEDPMFYNAPVIVLIHSKAIIPTPKEDCVLAGYNIAMAAQTLGLGSCFMSIAQDAFNSSARCRSIAGLTAKDTVHAVIILGYPAVKFLRPIPKSPKPIRWI